MEQSIAWPRHSIPHPSFTPMPKHTDCYRIISTLLRGKEAAARGAENLYLDLHDFGAGNVKASDVAAAHEKDLAVQKKYGVNFLNYWVDEKAGTVFCLAEAPDSNALILTHKEAHGLIPKDVKEVQQGQ